MNRILKVLSQRAMIKELAEQARKYQASVNMMEYIEELKKRRGGVVEGRASPKTEFGERPERETIMTDVATFDIEDTNFIAKARYDADSKSYTPDADGEDYKRAAMYIWMFCMCELVIIGRTWDEFREFLRLLISEVCQGDTLPIYVHNLPFEFSFLESQIEITKVFALDSHKPVKVSAPGIVFRDTLTIFGCKLEKVELARHEVKKLVGCLDYDKPRHHKTPLTDEELAYCIMDVIVLNYAVQEKLEDNDDDNATIPMTRTGYTRRKLKNAMRADKKAMRFVKSLYLDGEVYDLIRWAAAGGFTHASSLSVGAKIEHVASYDKKSFYPWAILANPFPATPYRNVYDWRIGGDFSEANMDGLASDEFTGLIWAAVFEGIEPIYQYEHYISASKCKALKGERLDNGRVVTADKLLTAGLEQDWRIIRKCYKWKSCRFMAVFSCTKMYLPKPIIETVLDAFEVKEKYKGVKGMELALRLAKEIVNGIFGCMYMDPVRDIFNFFEHNWSTTTPDVDEELFKYNSKKGRFLYYPWGVTVAAICREELWKGIFACTYVDENGNEVCDYNYSDTDSLKISCQQVTDGIWMPHEKVIAELKRLDAENTAKVYRVLDYYKIDRSKAAPKGKCIGIWDYEGTYKAFKTLGAKRYMYELEESEWNPDGVKEDDQYHCTVAGVGKKPEYIPKLHGVKDDRPDRLPDLLQRKAAKKGVDPFEIFAVDYEINPDWREGMSLDKKWLREPLKIPAYYTGKLTHTYFDENSPGPTAWPLTDYLGNTEWVSCVSGTHLGPQDYDLGMTGEYIDYLIGGNFKYYETC